MSGNDLGKVRRNGGTWMLAGRLLIVALGLIFFGVPAFASRYTIYLLSTVFVTALLATSLNFVLGYGGLMQLHQSVFYGVGAYTVAIVMTKTAWPFWVAVLAAPCLAALTASLIGWFCVRLRGLYFGMLTLALGQLVWAIAYRWNTLTGGDDGIHAIPVPDALSSFISTYYITLIVLILSLLLLYLWLKSPFGLILTSIRDNPLRAQSIGVNVKRHQLIALAISGFFAGLAGVMFVIVEGSVAPSIMAWNKSAEILIMCLMGGMSTFLGPSLGAAILVLLSMVVGAYTEYWLLALGLILLVLVLFLPQGALGFLTEKFLDNSGGGEGNQDAAR